MLLKAVNGKHLAYGEYFDNEESVKEEIVKAVIILKDNQLLLKKINQQLLIRLLSY
jgi:hypothetical protein